MGFVELPAELLLLISGHIAPADLSSLVRTSRASLQLLGPELDRRAVTHKVRDNDRTVLHWAAKHGHKQLAQRILDLGPDVGTLDAHRRTPLIVAVYFNQVDMVSLLIDRGAEIHYCNKYGRYALWHAARRRNSRIVRILIQAGADISVAHDNRSFRPPPPLVVALKESCELGDYGFEDLDETVRLLLDAGADPNILDCDEDSALDLAIRRRSTKLALMLLDAGATAAGESSLDQGMTFAVSVGSDQLVHRLFRLRPNIAAAMKSSVLGRKLSFFLSFAAMDPSILQKQEEKDRYFELSVQSHATEIVKYLLSEGADPPRKINLTPILHFAVDSGDAEFVQLLMENGADVHAKNRYGESSLHAALRRGQLSFAHLLIKQGVDVDSKTRKGLTPLFGALMRGNLDMADCFFDAGANIMETDGTRLPLLHLLVYEKCGVRRYFLPKPPLSAAIIDWVLKHGFDINYQDDDLRSALHLAVKYGDRAVTELLLERGADPAIQSKNGSALDIATTTPAKGDSPIVELLKKYSHAG